MKIYFRCAALYRGDEAKPDRLGNALYRRLKLDEYPCVLMECKRDGIEDIIDSIVFSETKMEFTFPVGESVTINKIRWTWFPEGHTWEWEFPFLD